MAVVAGLTGKRAFAVFVLAVNVSVSKRKSIVSTVRGYDGGIVYVAADIVQRFVRRAKAGEWPRWWPVSAKLRLSLSSVPLQPVYLSRYAISCMRTLTE